MKYQWCVAMLVAWVMYAQFNDAGAAGAAESQPAPARAGEALDLLQLAAMQIARGQNAEAEVSCRRLLDNPELLQHVDPLRVRALLGSCIRKQNRHAEAFGMLKDVLAEQRAKHGEDHPDVENTVAVIDGLTIDMVWPQAMKLNRPAREYEAALAVAEEAATLRLPNAWSLLALIRLRHGDSRPALEAITKSFHEDDPWLGQFCILAMALWDNGQQELARDAHAGVCDRNAKTQKVFEALQNLQDQTGQHVQMSGRDLAKDMSREQLLGTYSRLIDAYPEVGRLYGWRAEHLACLGRHPEAIADVQKATELDPSNWRFGEALATLRLANADPPEQTKICRQLWKECLEEDKYGSQAGSMDLVLLCSLAGGADVDRQKVLGRADEILAITPTRPFLELSRGMALYRCGRYEDALDSIPGDDAPFGNVKDRGLALIFRAMTHQKLGETFTAKRLLQTARKLHEEAFASAPVVRMPYQDAAVVDCMIRIALEEAQSLISPDGR